MARSKAFDEVETLEKAMHVFWKKGYHATSMEDLVSAMGISRASLYDTYGDKKQLYMAALKLFQSQSQRQNSRAVAASGNSPKAQLMAVLQTSLEETLADPDQRGCMMANATAELAILDEDVCQFAQGNICAVEAFFEKLLRAGQEQGEFRPDFDPGVAATFLLNYVHGMRIVSKTKPDADKMRMGLALAVQGLSI